MSKEDVMDVIARFLGWLGIFTIATGISRVIVFDFYYGGILIIIGLLEIGLAKFLEGINENEE